MFSTFQAATSNGTEDGDSESNRSGGNSKRISTSNACIECRRRKIRCDGAQPCGQCQWYQHPEQCAYAKPAQRIVPSRKLVEKLQSRADQYHSLFARLFPGKELESLLSLSREDLIHLAVTTPVSNTSPSETPGTVPSVLGTVNNSETAESLEALEEAPEQDPATDEHKRLGAKLQGISDDVNGLSLSVDKASSYVGVSSIPAALKVMFKTAPIARPFVSQETADQDRSSTPPPFMPDPDPHYLPPPDVGEKLIDSYFAHVHLLMPMVDEDQFRYCYLYSIRRDPPWLALLNMVLALGSLASSTCDNEDHIAFYTRARKHLDAESFGSGSLFVLQALGLLSGYYLHWLNRPNEANGIMGATLRMATAHGLHKEYGNIQSTGSTMSASKSEVPVEIKRRTWWSLYCLDSWASISTGRPSLGRSGPGITTAIPRIPEQMNNAQYLASLKLLPIIHNIAFCKIATKLQDKLAARSLLDFDELFALDAELEKWRDDLPPIIRDVISRRPASSQGAFSGSRENQNPNGRPSMPPRSTSSKSFDFSQPPERDNTACPEVLKTPRAIMHWRYQNLRMLMHRPVLLAAVLRRTRFEDMKAEEKVAVSRCRLVAGQAIADIIDSCQDHLIAGWNAVWLMYQAVMVPLVSLFSVLTMPPSSGSNGRSHVNFGDESGPMPTGSDDDVEFWNAEVENAIVFFKRMERWSVAAKKSGDVVQCLYDATKFVSQNNWQQQAASASQPARPTNGSHVFSGPVVESNDPRDFPQQYGMDFTTGWSVNPNGEAAVNEFWNDMMWDPFPHDSSYATDHNEWWGVGEQDWYQWQPGGSVSNIGLHDQSGTPGC